MKVEIVSIYSLVALFLHRRIQLRSEAATRSADPQSVYHLPPSARSGLSDVNIGVSSQA